MKKKVLLSMVAALTAVSMCGCGSSATSNGEVIVYNWGEYIDPEVIEMFEEEFGIDVIYDEYEEGKYGV